MNPQNDRLAIRYQVLAQVLGLNQQLLGDILRGDGSAGIHLVLRVLAQMAGADCAYLVLQDAERVISADFFAGEDNLRFLFPVTVQTAPLPAGLNHSRGRSATLYGGLELADRLTLVLQQDEQLLGVLELGCLQGELAPRRIELVQSALRGLHPALVAFRSHLVSAEAQRLLLRDLEVAGRMYRTILKGSHDLIVSFEPSGHILSMNQTGQQVLGQPGEAGSALDFVHPALEVILAALEERVTLTDMEVVLRLVTGAERFFLASFSAERDDKDRISLVHGIFKDITERVQIQSELYRSNMDLSEANRQLKANQQQLIQQEKMASIGQLAAGVAHEINNPLGFIQSNHQMLKKYLARLTRYLESLEGDPERGAALRRQHGVDRVFPELDSLLTESDDGFQRISHIIRSLKDFSHIDAQGRRSMVDLNQALQDTLTVARNSWKYVAEVETDFRLDQPVECYLDEMNQVFLNIVVNAAQALAACPDSRPGRIRIVTRSEAGKAIMEFEDNGPGIPPELRRQIFDPFYTTKPIGQGTGLGLSVSWDIVTKHHRGSLEVDKSDLGGALFRIRLPLVMEFEEVKDPPDPD